MKPRPGVGRGSREQGHQNSVGRPGARSGKAHVLSTERGEQICCLDTHDDDKAIHGARGRGASVRGDVRGAVALELVGTALPDPHTGGGAQRPASGRALAEAVSLELELPWDDGWTGGT